MLKIQVLGKGMIPRGMGLAPRLEPFYADLTWISTILATPGLKVNYINPETGMPKELTTKNLQKVWDKWRDVPVNKPVQTPVTAPHIPGANEDTPIKVSEGDKGNTESIDVPNAVNAVVPPVAPEAPKVEADQQEEKVEEATETSEDKKDEENTNAEDQKDDNQEEPKEEKKEDSHKTYQPVYNPNKNKHNKK